MKFQEIMKLTSEERGRELARLLRLRGERPRSTFRFCGKNRDLLPALAAHIEEKNNER